MADAVESDRTGAIRPRGPIADGYLRESNARRLRAEGSVVRKDIPVRTPMPARPLLRLGLLNRLTSHPGGPCGPNGDGYR